MSLLNIIKYIKDNIKDTTITPNLYYKLKFDFSEKYKLDKSIVNEIFNKLFLINYKFENNLDQSFREFYNISDSIIDIPDDFKELNDQFNKLKNLPQPVQRSKEWYDYRYNRITASDTASAVDLNPYEPIESFILKKCDPNFPFRDNDAVCHGKKYEQIATLIYEHIYDTKVVEFGALPSEKYNILGASPDGICSQYTLNNKFSQRLGIMLEIKCPITRDINISGKTVGDICPFYYYCQVQQQLLCCNLNKCDFWQCKITEYKTKEEFMLDDCSLCKNSYTISDDSINNKKTKKYNFMDINNKYKKGIILEFYPKKFIPEFEDDKIEWKSKYIYPNYIDMNETQYMLWILDILDQYQILYPDIYNNYYFHKIIYWKLEMSHNVTILKNNNFLNNIIPILYKTWDQVLYYRKNISELDILKTIVTKRKKYFKFNISYKIHNNLILKKNIKFLDNNVNKKIILNSNDLESDDDNI
jgi:putative phage-type endonuclease